MDQTERNKLEDVKQTVVVEAPIEKVWAKVATAEGIAEWFMPNDFVPEEGHEFHLRSPFGPSPCKVLAVEPPTRLKFSWDTDGWIITFELSDLGEGRTEFTLTHGGWGYPDDVLPKANEQASVVRERMGQGWVAIVGERFKKAAEA
ncbi:SRPBCC domain-containing protein [Paenibacillus spiritus]|uniref:SRPBCC domain-containing protein n=1 Tax=Paenibacillus spiritus TaxID=2496557 RepID=A0A5J5GDG4_9BACL|nr:MULTISPECIES: SRPBCC domain-containing protein [Paenibacillus]KAA9005822.1 SRPBCC domain-containing protein [Paenibacillus spiritus]